MQNLVKQFEENTQKFCDAEKFNVAMNLIYEMGKIIGGLTKYYAKYNKK